MKNLIILILIILGLSLQSCGSACARTHRYWNTHRCVQTTVKTSKQEEKSVSLFNSINAGAAQMLCVDQMQTDRGVIT